MGNTDQIKAVKMVRTIREEHYEILKNKNIEECILFYRGKSQKLNTQVKRFGLSETSTLNS